MFGRMKTQSHSFKNPIKLADATIVHKEKERAYSWPWKEPAYPSASKSFRSLLWTLSFSIICGKNPRAYGQICIFINNRKSPLEWLAFHTGLNFGSFAMPGKSQISPGTLTDKEKTSWTECLGSWPRTIQHTHSCGPGSAIFNSEKEKEPTTRTKLRRMTQILNCADLLLYRLTGSVISVY